MRVYRFYFLRCLFYVCGDIERVGVTNWWHNACKDNVDTAGSFSNACFAWIGLANWQYSKICLIIIRFEIQAFLMILLASFLLMCLSNLWRLAVSSAYFSPSLGRWKSSAALYTSSEFDKLQKGVSVVTIIIWNK